MVDYILGRFSGASYSWTLDERRCMADFGLATLHGGETLGGGRLYMANFTRY